MQEEIVFRPSSKRGLHSKEQYIVTRGRTVFLRVLGSNPYYEVMTATADEDDQNFTTHKNMMHVIEAATRTTTDFFNNSPKITNDHANRTYAKLGILNGLDDKDFGPFVYRFFKHLDDCSGQPTLEN